MTKCTSRQTLAFTICLALVLVSRAWAADLESFEFNDGFGFFLSETSNTANPGNMWVESNAMTDSETDGNGNFRIAKFNDDIANNYLQIDNITSDTAGSRFIVVRMSGWDFYENVPGEGEEIRFDFLENDTGDSGSTITSQVRIDRNTDTEAIELRGTAIGIGSSDIANRAVLNTTQTDPFTMVMELNKTSNTYEVFYKDGTNPSQSLGSGNVRPQRDGNSIRFTANNNFGSTLDEFFSIDRIALTDTNPLDDLLTVEIDRSTGEMTLINTSGSALSGLESLSITSAVGALSSSGWKTITDNYDNAAGPGDGSVDSDDNWSIETTSTDLLMESVDGGDGGSLGVNQEVSLSIGPNDGTWIQNPFEDVAVELVFADGVRRANVDFIGNGGEKLPVGDMNFDGALTADDWPIFIADAETDLAGLSQAQAYQAGDLNNDGVNDIFDFGIFKDAYNEANGAGAFEAMLASVPEPTGAMLMFSGVALLAFHRRRLFAVEPSQRLSPANFSNLSMRQPMTNICTRWSITIAFLTALTTSSSAAILEEFNFNDADGTLLGNTINSINEANTWNEDVGDMAGSSVQDGVFRVQKDNEDFATNYLDIANVTSGKAWLVAEISGWNISPTLGPDDEAEEIRFAFLDNDGNSQGGSTITGQAQFQRNDEGNFELVGRLLTSSVDFGPLPLTNSRTDPFTVALEIDEDNNTYSIFYKDDDAPFEFLGTAPHVSTRDGNSVRFVANNGFFSPSEFFDIDRIYLTDTDPTNVSVDFLTLQVNTATGAMAIVNNTDTEFDIDSYRISSSTGDLNFAGWTSLSSRTPLVDPVDGPDPGTTLGDGTGETWDEAAGADDDVLAESFLLGSSLFPNGRSESLGNAFQIDGNTGSLEFQYRNADSGAIVTGEIELVTSTVDADFDGDGAVDGNDFLIWQRGFGMAGQTDNSNGDADGNGVVDSVDLAAWNQQYGTGALADAATAVPEPNGLVLLSLAGLGWMFRRSKSLR